MYTKQIWQIIEPNSTVDGAGSIRTVTRKEGRDFLKAHPDFGYSWRHLDRQGTLGLQAISICTISKATRDAR